MPNCAVLNCKNSTKTVGRDKGNVSFHMFPSDPQIKEKWIEATGNKNWFPTKHSRICSVHFNDEYDFNETNKIRRLSKEAIPTIDILKTTISDENATTNRKRKHPGSSTVTDCPKIDKPLEQPSTTTTTNIPSTSTETVVPENATTNRKRKHPGSSTVTDCPKIDKPLEQPSTTTTTNIPSTSTETVVPETSKEVNQPLYYISPEDDVMVYNVPTLLNIMPIYNYITDVPKGTKVDPIDIFAQSIAQQIKNLPAEHANILKSQIQTLISNYTNLLKKSTLTVDSNVATDVIEQNTNKELNDPSIRNIEAPAKKRKRVNVTDQLIEKEYQEITNILERSNKNKNTDTSEMSKKNNQNSISMASRIKFEENSNPGDIIYQVEVKNEISSDEHEESESSSDSSPFTIKEEFDDFITIDERDIGI